MLKHGHHSCVGLEATPVPLTTRTKAVAVDEHGNGIFIVKGGVGEHLLLQSQPTVHSSNFRLTGAPHASVYTTR